jgi:hypothetical protein
MSEVMLSRSDLLRRGWTAGMIRKLLGGPNAFVTNPHYPSGAEMRLYYLLRVEAVEATSDFRMAKTKHVARSEAVAAGRSKRTAIQSCGTPAV